MSNSNLIPWFEQLLFGLPPACTPIPAPAEVESLLFRMAAVPMSWGVLVQRGGLTAFPDLIYGDLSYLIDFLEKQWLDGDPPREVNKIQSRPVTRFWNELQCLLAKRNEILPPPLPTPSRQDDAILQDFLQNTTGQGRYTYQSADFWGEVARRFIRLRKPPTLSPLPPMDPSDIRKLALMYHVHSEGRGYYMDPLTFHLVHTSEYVNAVHWQSTDTLKHFMVQEPTHRLTHTVQALLKETVEELLRGKKPSAYLHPNSSLDALFYNVEIIHKAVPEGPNQDTPPKLIDVLQRLLALSRQDDLWEREVPILPDTTPSPGTHLFYLTEQLSIYEKEKRLWMQLMKEDGVESAAETSRRICSRGQHAKNRLPG